MKINEFVKIGYEVSNIVWSPVIQHFLIQNTANYQWSCLIMGSIRFKWANRDSTEFRNSGGSSLFFLVDELHFNFSCKIWQAICSHNNTYILMKVKLFCWPWSWLDYRCLPINIYPCSLITSSLVWVWSYVYKVSLGSSPRRAFWSAVGIPILHVLQIRLINSGTVEEIKILKWAWHGWVLIQKWNCSLWQDRTGHQPALCPGA